MRVITEQMRTQDMLEQIGEQNKKKIGMATTGSVK